MFRLDYLSCFLTVVATILLGRKMWTGLVVACVNSFIVCVIGLHTSQYGFIPANLFCICINAFHVRAWLKVQKIPSESTTDVAAKCPAALVPALCRKGLTSRSNANAGTANLLLRSLIAAYVWRDLRHLTFGAGPLRETTHSGSRRIGVRR